MRTSRDDRFTQLMELVAGLDTKESKAKKDNSTIRKDKLYKFLDAGDESLRNIARVNPSELDACAGGLASIEIIRKAVEAGMLD